MPHTLSDDLAPALSYDLAPALSDDLAPALSDDLAPALSYDLAPALSYDLAPALSDDLASALSAPLQRLFNSLAMPDILPSTQHPIIPFMLHMFSKTLLYLQGPAFYIHLVW